MRGEGEFEKMGFGGGEKEERGGKGGGGRRGGPGGRWRWGVRGGRLAVGGGWGAGWSDVLVPGTRRIYPSGAVRCKSPTI